MLNKKLRAGIFAALCILLLSLVAAAALPLLLNYPPFQRIVLRGILENINAGPVQVSFTEVSLTFWYPIRLEAKDLVIGPPENLEFIEVSNLSATFTATSLLRCGFKPESLFLDNVRVRLHKKRAVQSRPTEPLKMAGLIVGPLLKVKYVIVRNGQLSMDPGQVKVNNIIIRLKKNGATGISHLFARARVERNGQTMPLVVKGTVEIDRSTDAPTAHILVSSPLFPTSLLLQPGSHLVIKKGRSSFSLDLNYRVDLASFHVAVKTLDPFFLLITDNRIKKYGFRALDIKFSGLYRQGKLSLPEFQLVSSDFSLKGSLAYQLGSKVKYMELKVSSSTMPYSTFRKIFPDPLVNPWLSERLFPVITKGLVTVDSFRLKGTVEQIANLDRFANRSCLDLRISWKQLVALENQGPFAFRDVYGKLVISNGSLDISGLKGIYGDSVVTKATLKVPNLYSENSEIEVAAEATASLADLPKLTQLPSLSSYLHPLMRSLENPQGSMALKISGRWLGSRGFVLDLGHFQVPSFHFVYGRIPMCLQEAEIVYRTGFGYSLRGKFLLEDSHFFFTARSDPAFSNFIIHAEGDAQIPRVLSVLSIPSYLAVQSPGTKHAIVSLAKSSSRVVLQCLVDFDGVEIKATEMFGITGKTGEELFFRFEKNLARSILRGEAILFQKNGFLQADLQHDLDKDTVEARFDTPKGLVEDLDIYFGTKRYNITAGLACNIRMKLTRGAPAKTQVFGRLNGYGVTIKRENVPTIFNDCQMAVVFDGKEININCIKTEVSGIPVSIYGHLKGYERLSGNLRIEVQELDLRGIFETKKSSRAIARQSASRLLPLHSSLGVNVEIMNTTYGVLPLGKLEAFGIIGHGNIHMESCRISSANTKVSAVGYLKSYPEQKYYVSTYIKITDQPIEELVRSIAGRKPFLEGSLTFEALLNSKGDQFHDLVRNLSGQSNFLIKKGKVTKSTVLIKILNFFSVQKIFTNRPPNLSKEGFYFEEIKGSLEVKDGIVHSDEVVMKSPVFNAIARGKVDLNNGQIVGDLGVQPFVALDSVLSRVPVVGYVLTGKERALLVYYFKLGGTLKKPEITYVPLKNMARSVLLFFKRVFLTPVRIFKNIGEKAKELAAQGEPVPLLPDNFVR